MKRPVQKAIVLAVGIVVIMLIAGCEEESQSNTKKSRLIAAENIQLKKEIEKQKELLEKCLQEKKTPEEMSPEGTQDLTQFLFEENIKLHEENEKLKAEIVQLEVRIKQLETELEELKKPEGPKPLPAEPQPL